MLALDGVLGLLLLGLWIYSIIDVITTPDQACRNLPKIVWLLIVILLVWPGAIVWLVAGRPWGPARANLQRPQRPQRAVAAPRSRPLAPDDDEEFLAGLRARAEEQRRRAREQQGDADPKGDPEGERP